MSTEIIAGHTFVEENYPIQDIGGGVISKGQAVRHFEKMHPEYTVVAVSSFKVDHQDETISIRVSVKPRRVVLPDENKKPVALLADPKYRGLDEKPIALLNPGYDEVQHDLEIYKNQYDELRIGHDELLKQYDALVLSRNHLVDEITESEKQVLKYQRENDTVWKLFDNVRDELDALKKKYDALVIAVGKDAQKFSDLLVENAKLKEELVKQYEIADGLTTIVANATGDSGGACEECILEDAADLAVAKDEADEGEQVGNLGLGEDQGDIDA